jgi:hypothetical protein
MSSLGLIQILATLLPREAKLGWVIPNGNRTPLDEASIRWLLHQGFGLILAAPGADLGGFHRGQVGLQYLNTDGGLVSWEKHAVSGLVIEFPVGQSLDWLNRLLAMGSRAFPKVGGGHFCIILDDGAATEQGLGSLTRQAGLMEVTRLKTPGKEARIYRCPPQES